MIDLHPAVRRMADVVTALTDDQLALPTPCPDLRVGDLVDHVGVLAVRFVEAARKADRGAPPPPPDAVGLRHYAVRLPDAAALSAVVERVRAAGLPLEETAAGLLVRDPAQNGVLLAVANDVIIGGAE